MHEYTRGGARWIRKSLIRSGPLEPAVGQPERPVEVGREIQLRADALHRRQKAATVRVKTETAIWKVVQVAVDELEGGRQRTEIGNSRFFLGRQFDPHQRQSPAIVPSDPVDS